MAQNRSAFRPGVEALEDRSLLSVSSVTVNGLQLVIQADDAGSKVKTYQNGNTLTVEDDSHAGEAPHVWNYNVTKFNRIVFDGGAGGDRFVNTANLPLTAHGGAGNDYLAGDNVSGDRLYGGGGFNTYYEPFDLNSWASGGYQAADVEQMASPTCTFLAALSEAAGRVNLGSGLAEVSPGTYRVRFYAYGSTDWQTVKFDGTWTDNDAQPSHVRDALGQLTGKLSGEFWALLYQRGYLELRGVNWSDPNTGDWGSAWKNGQTALTALTGWHGSTTNVSPDQTTDLAAQLKADLQAGNLVTAGTRAVTTGNVVSLHVYAVESVYQVGGVWMVRLYNPWGVDGPGASTDGKDDGTVTLTWAQFTANFNQVYEARF